jgi:hypothetical protein
MQKPSIGDGNHAGIVSSRCTAGRARDDAHLHGAGRQRVADFSNADDRTEAKARQLMRNGKRDVMCD